MTPSIRAPRALHPGPRDERRRWPRLPIRMAIRQQRGDELTLHTSRDLSAGGVQLDWSLSMPLGETVELRFALPEVPRQLQLKAEVAANDWRGRPNTSLRFVDVPDEVRQLLVRFVRHRLRGLPGLPFLD